MNLAGIVLVMANGHQAGDAPSSWHDNLLIGLLIAAMTVACVFIFISLRRRSRRARPVGDQWQALTVMGELCPHGWQAQITLYGWGAPVPDDAPPSRVPLVELEWRQFDEESGRVAVVRRVWAPTIGEALQMMVDDRRTDITLERIEQAAEDEDDVWWSD
jgi:hypothetical protein